MKCALGLVVGLFLSLVLASPAWVEEEATIDLVGLWYSGTPDHLVQHDVKADGTLRRRSGTKEKPSKVEGTWSIEGDVVTLTVDGGAVELKVKAIDDDHLDTWLAEDDEDEDATVQRWVRRRNDTDATLLFPALGGTWELKEEGLHWTLELKEDGAYAFHRETRGEVKEDAGTWDAKPGVLLLSSGGKKDELVGFNVRVLEGGNLELTLGIRSGKPKTWKKKGAEKKVPGIVGEWEVKGEALSVYIKINADGTFHHELKTPTGKEVSTGTWTIEGDKLIAKPVNEPVTYTLTWKLHGKDRLELFDPSENETTLLTRKGTKPGLPWDVPSPEVAKLAGTWVARSADLELTLVLGKDGTFKQTLRTKEGTDTTEGNFNVEGGHLLFVAKGESGLQKLPFTLEGKTLTLKQGDEVLAELVRQGDA